MGNGGWHRVDPAVNAISTIVIIIISIFSSLFWGNAFLILLIYILLPPVPRHC